MGRAYVLKAVNSGTTTKYLPMVYLGGKNQDYHPAHPDNDKKGSCFFIVKPTSYPSQQVGKHGFKEIDVSIIFTVNLKLINPVLLETENFTRHLIEDVEEVLFREWLGKAPQITVNNMTDLFSDVWQEVDIDTKQGKAYGKMNYFRFDLTIFFNEKCPSSTLNRCGAITQNLTYEDFCNCLFPLFDFGPTTDEWFDCLSAQQKDDLTTRLCGAYVNEYQMQFDGFTSFKQAPINAAYDFTSTDSFSLGCWVTYNILTHASIMSKYSFALTRGYWVNVMANGSIRFSIQNAGGANGIIVETTPGVLSAGVKSYVEAVYTGTETAAGMFLYVNGLPVTLTPVVDNLTAGADISNNEKLTLGALPTAGLYSFAAIDEWRVRNIGLTAPQVLIEHNGGTPAAPEAGGLILYDRNGEGAIFGVNENWVSSDLSGTLGVGKGTETALVSYSGRISA
jgi:hypothetical protein